MKLFFSAFLHLKNFLMKKEVVERTHPECISDKKKFLPKFHEKCFLEPALKDIFEEWLKDFLFKMRRRKFF